MNHFEKHRTKKYVHFKVYILYVNGDKKFSLMYSMEFVIPLVHNKVLIYDIHVTGTKEIPLFPAEDVFLCARCRRAITHI